MQNQFTLVVDNVAERQHKVVDILKYLRKKQPELPEPKAFESPGDAIAFSSAHDCPVVFTAIPLSGTNSFAMIEQIRSQNSHTNFILLAYQKEYIVQALMMKLRPSGSIMGMPDVEAIRNELDNLWYPLPS